MDLRNRIAYLEQELEDEKNHNIDTLIKEQVSSLCSNALVNYESEASKHEAKSLKKGKDNGKNNEQNKKQEKYKELY